MNVFYTINLTVYRCTFEFKLFDRVLYDYIYILIHIRHKYNIEKEGFKCSLLSINYLSSLPLAVSKIPKVLTRGRLMLTVERLISEVHTHSLRGDR